ncbi:Ig-like domain-containing protein [Ferrimonas sediminum]|uniref:Ig-like domain-containing protein n=1 Tax=Ferrimonas sediminum TaxID=718193 RepID=UPI000B84E5B4|nr:Ig-like domain-containing protein [Ferrimonas sediminum]
MSQANTARLQSEQLSLNLGRQIAAYRRAGAPERSRLHGKLLQQAEQRQQEMFVLAKRDPDAVLRAVLPGHHRQGLPEEILAKLEQRRQLVGELELYYEDYPDGSHRLGYLLNTDNGQVRLQRVAKSKSLKTGTRVAADGWWFGPQAEARQQGVLVLDGSSEELQVLADGQVSSAQATSSASLPNTLGEQRLLVMMVNFLDNGSQPWSLEQARQTVFGSVDDFYRENSGGQTWLSGDVHGYYTLPINATCDSWEIHVQAQQAAEADGIDLSRYNRMVYVFPENSACGWTGKGTIGGTVSRAWINGSLTLRTVGHELGHNLGLHHAKVLDCGADVIGDNCVSIEYGDSMDIMGKSGITGHFNAFNKELLGWISESRGEVVTADSDGSYQLVPLESQSSGAIRAIKVPRGTDPVSGEPLWYYLEYRQPHGFDAFLSGKAVTEGVVFHLATGQDAASSQLLDMTPESDWYDLDDAALIGGVSYQEGQGGATVTTEWADASGASVTVSLDQPICAPVQPELVVTPGEGAWVAPGTGVNYSATLTNRDSQSCGTTEFTLAATPPPGWSGDSASLTLAPGETASVILEVASIDSATDGFYDIAVTADSGSNHQVTAQVTYVVESPAPVCTASAPSLVLQRVGTGAVAAGEAVTYSATIGNQDSEACDAETFDLGSQLPQGWSANSGSITLLPGASGQLDLVVTSPSSAAEGVYSIIAEAVHRQANLGVTAAESYEVAAPLPVCELSAPELVLHNSDSGEVAAGTTVTYRGTIRSRDSEACDTSAYQIQGAVASGWSAAGTSVTLAPGASAEFAVSVTSGLDESEGDYAITILGQATEPGSTSGQVQASYRVASTNGAPLAQDDSVTLSSKSAVTIGVLSNDSDPDGDTLTVVAVTQGSKGSVEVLADGQLRYHPAKNFKGSDSFSYTISDGLATATAWVSVTLQDNGGGGGNGKKNH